LAGRLHGLRQRCLARSDHLRAVRPVLLRRCAVAATACCLPDRRCLPGGV